MAFKDVLGHSKPITLLQRAIRNGKVVNSYLFLGNEGIGKKIVALQFAKALNCLGEKAEEGEACDHCISCKKIDHALHPDVLLIEPEGQTIKVDQIRQLQKELVYRPYEGKRRVCILTAADRMAPHIPNTLLKTLEEPPLHTVIVLLANNSRFILPTILSRCQPIRFNSLPIPLVSKWLMEDKGFDQAESYLLASLSEGSPGKALEIQEEIRQIPREALLKDWAGLKSLSFERIGSWVESLPSQRDNLVLILEVTKTLLRDLVMVKTLKKGANLIHPDLVHVMESLAANWSLTALLKRMEMVHHAVLAIKANANTSLALEAMMLTWAEG
jgi:DNA polymerase-3 subunit delta'